VNEERSAAVFLADRALIAADGDEKAAKEMLTGALEAIGVLPYPPAPPKYSFRGRGR
jgi:hypothetical protein